MLTIAATTPLLAPLSHAATSAQPAPFDADNLNQAVAMVASENHTIELTRQYCSRQFPDIGKHVDYAALLWRDRNGAEIRDLIVQKMDGSAAAKTAASIAFSVVKLLSGERQRQYCTDFAVTVPGGARDVSVRTPRASHFLTEHLRDHPLSAQQVRAIDFVEGCVRASFNKGVAVDTADRSCQCSYTAMNSTFSETEWRSYADTARAGQPITNLPQVKRALPKLAQCTQTSAR